MKTASQGRDGWRQVVCGLCSEHESNQDLPEDSSCLSRMISSAEQVRRYTSNTFVTKHKHTQSQLRWLHENTNICMVTAAQCKTDEINCQHSAMTIGTSLLQSLLQLCCTTNQNWRSRNVVAFGKLLRQCSSKQRICSTVQNTDVTERTAAKERIVKRKSNVLYKLLLLLLLLLLSIF